MADIFSDSVDPSRDLARERRIEVSEGPAFVLKQYDPYGYWRIHREHGQVPEKLQGDYTTIAMARQAVDTYIGSMKSEPKKTKAVQ